jgi:hypothetical protein
LVFAPASLILTNCYLPIIWALEGNMIKKLIPIIIICMLFIGHVSQTYAQTDYQKALGLYQQVITGKKKLEDLSPEEQRRLQDREEAC